MAFGVWGALDCRAGFVVADATELPAAIGDYVERLVAPYFEAVAAWYSALRIGQTGGALYDIIERHLGDPFFGIFLNPGHQIELDEWVNSPSRRDRRSSSGPGWRSRSTSSRRPGRDYFTTNIEDGVALADASLRAGVRGRLPRGVGADPGATAVHDADALGIELHEDVLPFSNLPRTCRRSCSGRTSAMTHRG